MEYRSIRELNDRVVDWIGALPPDLDLVVGIPRSGMLAANLLALHLHLPLVDLEGFCAGRVLASGQRGVAPLERGRALRVLVVDDSVCSGASMRAARTRIAVAGLAHRILYGAVFATPEAVSEGEVDTFAEVVPMPRVFEWNILHTPRLAYCCVDLDGVLCAAPPYGPVREIGAALFSPRYRIGWIVAARPEVRRAVIEAWLDRHGIDRGRLILAGKGRSRRSAVVFKARVYRATGAELFITGDSRHAAAIAERAGKPVFCFSTRAMIYPGHFPRQRHVPVLPPDRLERAVRWLARLPGRCVRRLWRLVRGVDPVAGLSGRDTGARS